MPASFSHQLGALVRKNAQFQRRNKTQNLCLLSAPVVFSLLILLLQTLVKKELASGILGSDLKCGCECLLCSDRKNPGAPLKGPESPGGLPCLYSNTMVCLKPNTSRCGVEFSSPRQAPFCPIPEPLQYPELITVPRTAYRPVYELRGLPVLAVGSAESELGPLAFDFIPPTNLYTLQRLTRTVHKTQEAMVNATGGSSASRAGLDNEAFALLQRLDLRALRALLQGIAETNIPLGSVEDAPPNGFRDAAYTVSSEILQSENRAAFYVVAQNCSSYEKMFAEALEKMEIGRELDYSSPGPLLPIVSPSGEVLLEKSLFEYEGYTIGCQEARPRFFQSAKELQNLLYCASPRSGCPGKNRSIEQYSLAFDFSGTSTETSARTRDGELVRVGPRFEYRFWYNNSDQDGRPPLYRMGKPLNLATNAFLRRTYGYTSGYAVNLLWTSEMPKGAGAVSVDLFESLGPTFFTWVLLLLFPVTLQALVYEKEHGLRIIMRQHGLKDAAYLVSTLLWWAGLYVAYFCVLLAAASAMQVPLFTQSDLGLLVLTFLFHGLMQVALAYLLSCFFSSSKTATVFSYIYVFTLGLISFILLPPLYLKYTWSWAVDLVPGFALFRGLWEFSEYAAVGSRRGSPGLRVSNLVDRNNGLLASWAVNIVESLLFMPLALYLEQVLDDKTGVQRHWLFPLEYLRPSRAPSRVEYTAQLPSRVCPSQPDPPSSPSESEDASFDVQTEKARALSVPPGSSQFPIVCCALTKRYPGASRAAVSELSLAIEAGECFGLLGQNGGGKTTTLKMLSGTLTPESGEAFLAGCSITRQMNEAFDVMGVCPQHEALWDNLTIREHLQFYGRIRGLRGKELEEAVHRSLQDIALLPHADKLIRQCSGGMKRRLSVAISLIGNPSIVYMDEPSSGLDPASRRALWNTVRANKAGRGMILTTHSMQEAEALCDRVGFIVRGRLVCIGPPQELIRRYGGYLLVSITSAESPDCAAAVRRFMAELAPSSLCVYEHGGTMRFKVPLGGGLALSSVFEAIDRQTVFPLVDFAISHPSLQEIFVEIARIHDA